MGVEELGAVCDVSLLADRGDFEDAWRLLDGGELCLPSATYGWLARDKLISVRDTAACYSLVSQLVRDGELLVVYLPELLDEISRRLLFEIDHKVPLTDIRAIMLAAHLGLPLLTLEEEPVKSLREHVGARTLWHEDIRADRRELEQVVEMYRELTADVGYYLSQRLDKEEVFDGLVEKLGKRENRSQPAPKSSNQTREDSCELSFECLAWDLTPILCDYLEQHVLHLDVVQELCERSLLLVASPK